MNFDELCITVELESTESLLPKKSIGFSDSNKIDHLAPPTFVDGGPKSAANTGQVSALTGYLSYYTKAPQKDD